MTVVRIVGAIQGHIGRRRAVFHVKHIHKSIHNRASDASRCGQSPATRPPIRPVRRRLPTLIALLAASALVLTGCGGVSVAAGWAAPIRLPDGSVLVQVKPGEVRAIDPISGGERWHFPNSVKDEKASKRVSKPVKGTFYAAPVIDGDRIYLVSYEGHLARIDRAPGSNEILNPWTVEIGENVVATPALAGGRLYVPTESGRIVVVQTEDGTTAATFDLDSGRIWGAPLVAGQHLVVTSLDGKHTTALRLSDGAVAWSSAESGASIADVVASGTSVLVGSLDGALYAHDSASGEVRWTFATDGWVTGTPLVAGDAIYLGTMGGSVYALGPDGLQRWRYALDGDKSEFRSSPALVNGVLVVAARRGAVVGLDPANGQQKWRAEVSDARLDANPLVLDGSVLLMTTKHALIRVDAASGAMQQISGPSD